MRLTLTFGAFASGEASGSYTNCPVFASGVYELADGSTMTYENLPCAA